MGGRLDTLQVYPFKTEGCTTQTDVDQRAASPTGMTPVSPTGRPQRSPVQPRQCNIHFDDEKERKKRKKSKCSGDSHSKFS